MCINRPCPQGGMVPGIQQAPDKCSGGVCEQGVAPEGGGLSGSTAGPPAVRGGADPPPALPQARRA